MFKNIKNIMFRSSRLKDNVRSHSLLTPLFLILLIFFLIPLVSSLTFDNVKSYDKGKNEITIINAFGLGADLAKVQLTTNTNFCLTECSATWNATIYSDGETFLDKLTFKTPSGSSKEITYKFEYISSYEEVIVDDYETICTESKKKNINGTFDNNCIKEVVGTHKESIPIWNTINPKSYLKGNYIIKLTGYKQPTESIDWIPTFFGQEVSEWTWWIGVVPSVYWKFNEADGSSTAIDSVGNINLGINLTGGRFVAGKLNNAFAFNSTAFNSIMANGTNSSLFAFDTGNFTIAFWINASKFDLGIQMMGTQQNDFGWTIDPNTNGTIMMSHDNLQYGATPFSVANNSFQRVVFVREGTGTNKFRTYINGTNVRNDTFNKNITNFNVSFTIKSTGVTQVMVDDFQIFKGFAWTTADVNTDWNNGTGLEGEGVPVIGVNLNSPPNAFSNISNSLNFSANVTAGAGINQSNATLYVWRSNGTIYTTKTNLMFGIASTNTTNYTLNNILTGSYLWNVYGCASNNNCTFDTANRTFIISAFTENSQTFNNNSFSFQNEQFKINITYDSTQYIGINGYLYYNNTLYSSTANTYTNGAVFTANLVTPQVASLTNISFVWNLAFQNASTITFSNSSFNNQSVNILSIDDCTTGTVKILNYTMFDEESENFIATGGSQNATFSVNIRLYPINSNASFIEYAANKSGINPFNICANLNFTNTTQYALTSQVRYSSNNRVIRFNNMQNVSITNATIPMKVPLYDLENSSSQDFFLIFKGNDFLFINGAVIDISKKYINQGVYKTVESPLTDINGQVTAHLILSNALYTITVKKNNQILGIFQDVIPQCQNPYINTCSNTFNILSTTANLDNYNTYKNMNYLNTFVKSTRTQTTIFNTIDGSTSTVLWNVTRFDARGNTTICTQTLSTSSGTFICTIPSSYGNSSVMVNLYSNGNFISSAIFDLSPIPESIFGFTGTIMMILMYMTLVLILVSSSVGIVIGAMLGILLALLLNLMSGGSILGVTSTLIWFVIAGAIIIWRITETGRGV